MSLLFVFNLMFQCFQQHKNNPNNLGSIRSQYGEMLLLIYSYFN